MSGSGEALYGAARGGRIPGAVHYNYDTYFDPDWTLKDHNQLQDAYDSSWALQKTRKQFFIARWAFAQASAYFTLQASGISFNQKL